MEKILLVEDDQSLGNSLNDFLKMEGFDVVWVQDLAGAKEAKLEDYRLIIQDWMLPDGQGIDFLKEIRSEGNNIPIIMLTAKSDLIDKVVGLETGANDYMTKPFDVEELFELMKKKKYRVSKATIYNTIDLLLACNLIRKHQFGKNLAQYEKSYRYKKHDHIIITDTEEVIEFSAPQIKEMRKFIEDKFNVTVLHH